MLKDHLEIRHALVETFTQLKELSLRVMSLSDFVPYEIATFFFALLEHILRELSDREQSRQAVQCPGLL